MYINWAWSSTISYWYNKKETEINNQWEASWDFFDEKKEREKTIIQNIKNIEKERGEKITFVLLQSLKKTWEIIREENKLLEEKKEFQEETDNKINLLYKVWNMIPDTGDIKDFYNSTREKIINKRPTTEEILNSLQKYRK